MKKNVGDLSTNALKRVGGSFVGWTDAHALVFRFCEDVENDVTPDKKDLRQIANALAPILEIKKTGLALTIFAKKLGLVKKQGQEISAQKKWMLYAHSVVEYFFMVEQWTASGVGKKEAKKKALEYCAEKNKIQTDEMSRRIRKYKTVSLKMADFLKAIP
jgi:hypothetical protein